MRTFMRALARRFEIRTNTRKAINIVSKFYSTSTKERVIASIGIFSGISMITAAEALESSHIIPLTLSAIVLPTLIMTNIYYAVSAIKNKINRVTSTGKVYTSLIEKRKDILSLLLGTILLCGITPIVFIISFGFASIVYGNADFDHLVWPVVLLYTVLINFSIMDIILITSSVVSIRRKVMESEQQNETQVDITQNGVKQCDKIHQYGNE